MKLGEFEVQRVNRKREKRKRKNGEKAAWAKEKSRQVWRQVTLPSNQKGRSQKSFGLQNWMQIYKMKLVLTPDVENILCFEALNLGTYDYFTYYAP